MGRIIPNENTWIGFVANDATGAPADYLNPTAADIAHSDVVNLTPLVASITANAQGNTIPTPSLDSLFETSVPGTSQAQFQADMYRDDVADTAWDALPRNKQGFFYISRFGGTGTDKKPLAGDYVEVWPVHVTSRTPGPLASNTPQTFSVTCAVNVVPQEGIIVAA